MALSKKERVEALSKTSEHHSPTLPRSKKPLFISIFVLIGVLVVAGAGFAIVEAGKPGYYDEFAQCLNEQGAVMYGASWCEFTHAQNKMFGKSHKKLDYRDYSENDNVRVTPTWYIDGEAYENVQSFDRLSSLTGCEYIKDVETAEE